MKLKIKKLDPRAVIPSYANPGDAGLDLTAISAKWNSIFNFHEYDTGLAFGIPEGHVGLVFPRSSISKTRYSLCNAVAVIDSTYRGSVKLRFYIKDDMDDTTEQVQYQVGDKVGQLIVMPYPKVEIEEVQELDETERGEGGFGSSGK